MSRGVRCIGLRAILTLFVVLMSAGIAPLYAEDAGTGTPVPEVTEPVDPAPEPTEPTEPPAPTEPAPEPPVDEGETPPATEPSEDEVPPADEGTADGGEVPAGTSPTSDEGVVETPAQSSNARSMEPQQTATTIEVVSAAPEIANSVGILEWELLHDSGQRYSGKIENSPPRVLPILIEIDYLPWEFAAGTYTLTIDAGDEFQPFSEIIEVSEPGYQHLGTVELRPIGMSDGSQVTINGVTSDDGGAEGALVTVTDANDEEIAFGALDANNQAVGDLPEGGYTVTVDATAQGYDVGTAEFTVTGEDRAVNVDLTAQPTSVPLTLSLALADDATAEDVSVSWSFGAYGTDYREEGTGFQDIPVTLFDGTVEPGSYWLIVSADGYEEIRFEGASALTIEEGAGPVSWHFVLEPLTYPVTIVGETSDNGPVYGALVTVTDADDSVVSETTLWPANSAVVELADGDYTVTVDATQQWYDSNSVEFTVEGAELVVGVPLTAQAPLTDQVFNVESANPDAGNVIPAGSTWEIGHAGDFGGTIYSGVWETDTPLPATVAFPEERLSYGTWQLVIDTNGAFDVFDEPVSMGWTGDFPGDEWQSATATLMPGPVGQTFTVVSADPDIANEIPAGSTWTIDPRAGRGVSGTWDAATTLPTVVDAGNQTDFVREVTLTIDAGPAFEPFEVTFSVPPRASDLGTFELIPVEPETFTVTGTVTDAETDAGIPGATVTVEEAGLRTTTGDDGTYSFDEVTEGDYTFVFSAEGYVTADVPATINAESTVVNAELTPVDVDPAPGTITVTVVDATTGEPIEGAYVGISIVEAGFTDADGEFTSANEYDPDITYEVSAIADGYQGGSGSVTIEDGPAGTTIELTPLADETFPVTFVANTSDEGSAEGALVYIERVGIQTFQAPPADGTLDAGNSFTTDLPAGDYIVTIDGTAQGYGVVSLEFSVPEDGTLVLNLQLQAASVTIEVRSADPEIANTMPEGSTWTVTHLQSGEAMTDTFLPEHLDLPATITVTNPVPVGDYIVEVDAGPTFAPYVMPFAVTADSAEQVIEVTLVPVVEEPTTGFVGVNKLYCTGVSTVIFFDIEDLDDDAFDFIDENCEFGPATFTFYLVGDGTDDYVQLEVEDDGFGLIELEAGTYKVIEEGTQASIVIDVVAGEAQIIGVINPVADDGDIPVDPVDPKDPKDPDKDGKKDGKDAVEVTELPKTGHGAADSTGMLMLASALASVVAGAGALVVRSRRI